MKLNKIMVFVQKVESEYGDYLDKDGVRYEVNYAHGVPDPENWQLFNSVEEAIETWGLVYSPPEPEPIPEPIETETVEEIAEAEVIE